MVFRPAAVLLSVLLLLLLVLGELQQSEAKRKRRKVVDAADPQPTPAYDPLDVYSEPPSADESRLITPRGIACRRMVTIPSEQQGWLTPVEVQELNSQLEECGFLYFAPGSAVSEAWVEAAHRKVRRVWGAFQAKPELAKRYATPIPAGGKRVDIVIPPEQPDEPGGGAFNDSMFHDGFAPALFQLLDAGLEDCCSLQMMVVKNALHQTRTGNPDTDGREQTWHDDSLPGLFDQQFGVAVALHEMESGQIAVQPGCFPPEGFHHRTASEESKGDDAPQEPPCFSTPGFAPERIAAGTVLLHRARLRHRGLWNAASSPHPNRFNLQLNIAPLYGWQQVFAETTAHGQGLWARIHQHRRTHFESRVKEVLAHAASRSGDESSASATAKASENEL